ncbi:glutamate 5-kinase [Thermosynechococcaceae cyanobacterium BACA0444]|uniref:Glutamate 5-kinase n=1 Tax=Pseudocalidococcus azoricus BACA0444 TaxID=2918990 RepID=A0AAE4FS00_9CYAN|nr:glutamate 5-kinase [Pseudocalidococcus azoricus]MDS3861213.1 glutamate 5-kinase [Pseudocalidococcus azoricus BACA0444]
MESQGNKIVIKIGTSSLTQPASGHLALATVARLVEVLCQLRQGGNQVVLVSSGAVGVGAARLGLKARPQNLALKQAVAAVGQGRLIHFYDDFFSVLEQPIAQLLLTRQDLIHRQGYINAYNTFQALLELGIIPIVNENDTVAVEELKFGDNDTLSALVASLIEADWLFLLTDVDRLYSADPRRTPAAQPISIVHHLDELAALSVEIGGRGSAWGTGGMATKISAAEIATEAGVRTVITDGQQPENILKILGGEALGTQFMPQAKPVNARKRWIARALIPQGQLHLDGGAIRAIQGEGRSLLAAGIKGIAGVFQAEDAVQVCDLSGTEIARGLVNYNSSELALICGQHSEDIPKILGYAGPDTVIHRDNLVIF